MKKMTRLFNGYKVFDRLFEEYIKLIVHLLSLMANEKSIASNVSLDKQVKEWAEHSTTRPGISGGHARHYRDEGLRELLLIGVFSPKFCQNKEIKIQEPSLIIILTRKKQGNADDYGDFLGSIMKVKDFHPKCELHGGLTRQPSKTIIRYTGRLKRKHRKEECVGILVFPLSLFHDNAERSAGRVISALKKLLKDLTDEEGRSS